MPKPGDRIVLAPWEGVLPEGPRQAQRGAPQAALPSPPMTLTTDQKAAAQAIVRAVRRVEAAEDALDAAVERARAKGVTWEAIATALGVSRQAAWERFRHVEDYEE